MLLETVESNGVTYRVITAPITQERTAQIARPIDETRASLDRLAIILALVTAGGTLVGLVTALFTKHRILTQLAGHDMDVIKILPPLIIGEREIDCFVRALDAVLADCGRFPGPIWDLGANFVRHTLRRPAPEPAGAVQL